MAGNGETRETEGVRKEDMAGEKGKWISLLLIVKPTREKTSTIQI